MAKAHLQEQWKKVAPPTNNTALTDFQTDLTVLCVMCSHRADSGWQLDSRCAYSEVPALISPTQPCTSSSLL